MKSIFLFLLFIFSFFSQNNWVKIESPFISNISALFAVNETTLLAGSKKGSIFLSEDAGKNWKTVKSVKYSPDTYKGVSGFTRTPDGKIFAVINSVHMNGLFESEDNGHSWNYVPSDIYCDRFTSVNSDLFAISDKVLYKSTDQGNTWQLLKHFDNTITGLKSFEDRLFLWGDKFLNYSSDGGQSWVPVPTPELSNTTLVDISSLGGSTLLLTTYKSVFYSTDDGINWTENKSGLAPNTYVRILTFFDGSRAYLSTLTGIYYSDNLAGAWNLLNEDVKNVNIKKLVFVKDKICYTTNYGLFVGDESGSVRLGKGVSDYFPRKSLLKNDRYLFVNSDQGFFRYDLETFNAELLGEEIFPEGATDFSLNETVIIAQSKSKVFYASEDNGASWIEKSTNDGYVTSIIPSAINSGFYMSRFDPYSEIWVDGFFFSENNGATWSRVEQEYSDFGLFDFNDIVNLGDDTFVISVFDWAHHEKMGIFWQKPAEKNVHVFNTNLTDISSIKLGVDNKRNIFAGTPEGLWEGSVEADPWKIINPELTAVTDIQSSNGNLLAVVSDNKLYTYDNNKLWQQIDTEDLGPIVHIKLDEENYPNIINNRGEVYRGETPLRVEETTISPTLDYPSVNEEIFNPEIIFKWTNNLGYVTNNTLEISTSEDFTDKMVFTTFRDSMKLDFFEEYTTYYWRVKGENFAGESQYSDVRKFKYFETTTVDDHMPLEFALAQNFPNPFNGTTTFKYTLPENAGVEVAVYNVLGEIIYQENLGEMERGIHYYKYNSVGNSSGIFIFRLTISGQEKQTLTKKIILLK
ncbi:MAG: hypothetical protein SCALA702_04520 [Melioribacteraceae bacterium]|nr:MAG: hypothetical protein SCALA702_04520 [Melioribacteraceae bacterium]